MYFSCAKKTSTAMKLFLETGKTDSHEEVGPGIMFLTEMTLVLFILNVSALNFDLKY